MTMTNITYDAYKSVISHAQTLGDMVGEPPSFRVLEQALVGERSTAGDFGVILNTDDIADRAIQLRLWVPDLPINRHVLEIFPALKERHEACLYVYAETATRGVLVPDSEKAVWLVPMYAYTALRGMLDTAHEHVVRTRKMFQHQAQYAQMFINRWQAKWTGAAPYYTTTTGSGGWSHFGNVPLWKLKHDGDRQVTGLVLNGDHIDFAPLAECMAFSWEWGEIPGGQQITVSADDYEVLTEKGDG